jgi:hypothetical protein
MGLPPVACRELPDTANHDARYQHRRGPVEDIIIAEGDKVVIRRTCTGTHHDTFRSIAPGRNRFPGSTSAFATRFPTRTLENRRNGPSVGETRRCHYLNTNNVIDKRKTQNDTVVR